MDQSHVQFLTNVEILFHDAQYLAREYLANFAKIDNNAVATIFSTPSQKKTGIPKELWGHSTVEYVVKVAYFARMKHLLLLHHDPCRSDDKMDDIVRYAGEKVLELHQVWGLSSNKDKKLMKLDSVREGQVFQSDPFSDDGDAICHDYEEENDYTDKEEKLSDRIL